MKTVNGQIVPEGLSISKLEDMMDSSNMQTFAIACEALRLSQTQQAYDLLKKHLTATDPYKRRYVLSVIFDYPDSSELTSNLEQALQSKFIYLVTTALNNIIHKKARIADEQIIAAIERNHASINSYYFQALTCIENTEQNTERIIKLYHSCKQDSQRISVAECLYYFSHSNYHLQLFDLFKDHPIPHIRILACKIARDLGRKDLLQKFAQDKDGHIRKLVSEFHF